ncbi:hypothetical protein RI367_001756 [Sorochytrium milnesiophthora]
MAVFGSGGHTMELLQLVDTLTLSDFSARVYVVGADDSISVARAHRFESTHVTASTRYTICVVPRARKVGQSWLTTPLTTLQALAASVYAVLRHRPSIAWLQIVCNGPGTCVPVCVSGWVLRCVNRLLTLGRCADTPQVVYVESFARVKSLSLSGSIIYRLHLADRFLVQWRYLADTYPRAEYYGVLV